MRGRHVARGSKLLMHNLCGCARVAAHNDEEEVDTGPKDARHCYGKVRWRKAVCGRRYKLEMGASAEGGQESSGGEPTRRQTYPDGKE
jgi:hypothetical protein